MANCRSSQVNSLIREIELFIKSGWLQFAGGVIPGRKLLVRPGATICPILKGTQPCYKGSVLFLPAFSR